MGVPLRFVTLGLVLIGAAACTSDPAAIKIASIRLGDELLARGQYGQAAGAYLEAVNADPQDGRCGSRSPTRTS